MNTLEIAKRQDYETCCRIINEGRSFQREQGFVQWDETYPTPEMISHDIDIEKGYVLKLDGEIAGYMFIDFSGEPAYLNIKGEWRSNQPYGVVHRMAFGKGFQGRGLSNIAFELIEKLCLEKGVKYIRIDTDFPNKRMQHVLTKNGFVNCGIIEFQGEKLAYDKLL